MRHFAFALILLLIQPVLAGGTAGDRWPYVEWSKTRIHGWLTSYRTLAVVEKSLSAQDAEMLDRIITFIEASDPKYEAARRIRDFAVPFELSADQRLFQLNPGEPARTAVTSSGPRDPVYFNMNIINDPSVAFGLLDAVQITIHELGRKVAAANEMTVVDSLAAIVKRRFQQYVWVAQGLKGVSITVPIEWKNVLTSGAGSFFEHEIQAFAEIDGRVYFYSKKIPFQTGLRSGTTYVATDYVSLGRLEEGQHTAYGHGPLMDAVAVAGLIFNAQVLQIVDVAIDVNHRTFKLRLQAETGLENFLHNAAARSVFMRTTEFFDLKLSWPETASSPAAFWSDSMERESKLDWFVQEGLGLKSRLDLSDFIVTVQVPAGAPAAREYHLGIDAGGTSIPVASLSQRKVGALLELEFRVPQNLVGAAALEANSLVFDRHRVAFFDSALLLKPVGIPTSSGRNLASLALEEVAVNSIRGWMPLIRESALENDAPGASPTSSTGKSSVELRFTLNSALPVRVLRLHWQELVRLNRNGSLAGDYRLNRQRFFTEKDFKQTTNGNRSEITVSLPPLDRMELDEFRLLQKQSARHGLDSLTANIVSLTKIEFVNSEASVVESEYGIGLNRSYYSFRTH